MGKRYYLDRIGVPPTYSSVKNENRLKHWEAQRKKYGFDDRDTWSLDYTMILLLYERLCMYLDIADDKVDLEFHEIEIDSVTKTHREWILELIEIIETYLGEYNDSMDEGEIQNRIWNIWMHIQRYMWW